jgi:micrococcal nuclease
MGKLGKSNFIVLTFLILSGMAVSTCTTTTKEQLNFPTAINAIKSTSTPNLIRISTAVQTITPTATQYSIINGACIPTDTKREIGTVSEVIDGDTIKVIIDGVEYRVRYIGMDAPEIATDVFAAYAEIENTKLVLGRQVLLIKDVSERDYFGRLLRYVVVGNIFVNDALVRAGWALEKAYRPDTACNISFNKAQRVAQDNNLGIWNNNPNIEPPTKSGEGIEIGVDCDPSYPDICIPSPPPKLTCKDIDYRNFRVTGSDPHGFDGNNDGWGCAE